MSVCPECGERLCENCLDGMACPCIEENEEIENEDRENDENPTTTVAASDTNEEHNDGFDVIREAARATETTVGIDAA